MAEDCDRPPVSTEPLHGRFKRVKQISKGGNSSSGVFIVLCRSDDKNFVEKEMTPKAIVDGSARAEMEVLRSLKHPGIVEYISAFIQNTPLSISGSLYIEQCEYGSLHDLLDHSLSMSCTLDESSNWNIFKQLIDILGYLRYGIRSIVEDCDLRNRVEGWRIVVHRDIKPENILLQRDASTGKPQLKLADFGCVSQRDMKPGHKQRIRTGDLSWCPPEIPNTGPYTDIYMAGAVIQMCSLMDGPAVVYILYGLERRCRGASDIYSDDLDSLLRYAMQYDWRKRPSVCELACAFNEIQENQLYGRRANSWAREAAMGL